MKMTVYFVTVRTLIVLFIFACSVSGCTATPVSVDGAGRLTHGEPKLAALLDIVAQRESEEPRASPPVYSFCFDRNDVTLVLRDRLALQDGRNVQYVVLSSDAAIRAATRAVWTRVVAAPTGPVQSVCMFYWANDHWVEKPLQTLDIQR